MLTLAKRFVNLFPSPLTLGSNYRMNALKCIVFLLTSNLTINLINRFCHKPVIINRLQYGD